MIVSWACHEKLSIAKMHVSEVLDALMKLGDPKNVAGMARFGIKPAVAYGVPKPALRKLARQLGTDHDLARQLWASGVHDARVLASMIEDPVEVTITQMCAWAHDFDNWDICDQCCLNLFWRTEHAHREAVEWSADDREFVKRAGFVLMASLSVHDKKAGDAAFEGFLSVIKREATDDRGYVRKSVNWALRQIGKRNAGLRRGAIGAALELQQSDSRSARWIGSDALRELTSEAVRRRVGSR
jgi:3-methyladenine DNA glycosylase AlkD